MTPVNRLTSSLQHHRHADANLVIQSCWHKDQPDKSYGFAGVSAFGAGGTMT